MQLSKRNNEHKESRYRLRILSCIALAELIALAFFNLWPVPEPGDDDSQEIYSSEENITLEDVQITRQESRPPPPPRPQVPVPVPDDEIVEEDFPELEDINITEYADDPLSEQVVGQQGTSDEVVSSPQIGPSVVRIVEPHTPEEAKKANIKVEVWVTFLVDKEGRVEDANISQIRLFEGNDGDYKTPETIGYGITEATLKAALQWKFRPARHNGEPVKAYTRHIFTYGF